ncbi:MAG: hypothetical protein ACYCUM_05140, partial [Solirubrobacteraceae bacterium]
PQLADDLLRRVPASLHQSSFLAHHHGREKLSQGSDRTYGVRPVGLGVDDVGEGVDELMSEASHNVERREVSLHAGSRQGSDELTAHVRQWQ